MTRPLVIDCDPGIDDAIAILMALGSPELAVLGITTVAGNVSVETTHTNARALVELVGHTVPVYRGCPRPLVRSPILARDVHGNNGLGGVVLPVPQRPVPPEHAVSWLIQTLSPRVSPIPQSPPMTIAALGPLTNLAVALVQAPEIATHIQDLVIMGGAIAAGNVTSSAEFNFFADPHAAQIVLTSGIPVTLIPLDLTHQVLASRDRRQALRQLNPIGAHLAQMLETYSLEEQQRQGWDGPPVHDPCVIAYLLDPSLFVCTTVTVAIETSSPLTLGRLVQLPEPSPPPSASAPNAIIPNATIPTATIPTATIQLAQSIDVEGFYQRLLKAIARLA